VASEVSICNEALDLLGAARITSLTEDSTNARECNACYTEQRDRELERHPWNFARTRVVLAPNTTAPVFDFSYAFLLPVDCLRVLLPNDRNTLDWSLENHNGSPAILTNDGTSINLKYIKQITDPNSMPPTFRGALAAMIAWLKCEKITQSNTKKADAMAFYKFQIGEARRTNAFQRVAEDAPEDSWMTARTDGTGVRNWLAGGG
jgi:hypothetical protein